jgi:predicted dehydrogenase
VAFICTPDVTHYSICAALSAARYDVLLEKPIATSLPDCLAMLDVQHTHRNRIFVAHVLRYAPFFRTLKEIVASRRYGLVRNLRLTENIGTGTSRTATCAATGGGARTPRRSC